MCAQGINSRDYNHLKPLPLEMLTMAICIVKAIWNVSVFAVDACHKQ